MSASFLSRRALAAAALSFGLCLASTEAAADVAPEPPSAQISSPMDGQTYEGGSALIDVMVDAFPGDDGIANVLLRVDGEQEQSVDTAPYTFFDVLLDEGMHELVVVAVSPGGDQYPSNPVNVVVFAAGETGTGGDTAETTGAEEGSSTTGDGDSEEGGSSSGCAVSSSTRLGSSGGMILLGLFCLGLAYRRRERELA